MKRQLIYAALLLAALTACTTTQVSNTNSGSSSTMNAGNANASATPGATSGVSEADITAKERQVWDALKSQNFDAFAALLAQDMTYVTDDGVHDKTGTVDGVKALKLTDALLSDWKVVTLDKDAAVVTYTITAKGTSGGHELPGTPLRASTAWVNRNGQWLAVYHQDTAPQEPPPGNANSNANANASATPAAKTTASPAASPSTAADTPEARERQIWDALKRRDTNGFAAFLAEDAMEVEPTGVYDKAGSVKGISQVDFSKTALSDFKTAKLDEDAALVTYMVKGPQPTVSAQGERHTTIWVRRGGQWLAAFHQGTPVSKSAPQ